MKHIKLTWRKKEKTLEYDSYNSQNQKYVSSANSLDRSKEVEYEILEREILPNTIICPDCGGLTLEGLEFCDKCGGELLPRD